MLTLIDNYDSFTYNLLHRLGEVGAPEMRVYRNDEKTAEEILAEQPNAIILSPGPCTPDQAGICLELCQKSSVPLLGVCLGHQSLAQAYGAKIVRASAQFHGKVSSITHTGTGLFSGLKSPIDTARYHSLTIDPETLPEVFAIDAQTNDGVIMAIHHKTLPLYGVQFHPESIASPDGFAILKNFLSLHQIPQRHIA